MTTPDGSEVLVVRHNGNDLPLSLRAAVRAGQERERIFLDGTTLTLTQDHAFALVVTRNSSAVTITVPSQATLSVLPLTPFMFRQGGTGAVTFEAASGVTINTPETLTLAKQHAVAMLIPEGVDIWTLSGYLEAAA
jgi:hypothetical protein